MRLQRCEEDRKERELEAQEQKNRVSWTHLQLSLTARGRDSALFRPQVERLQQALHSLEEEAELLRSKLSAVNQEKLDHAQEVSCLHRELQDAEKKVRNGRPSASTSHHHTITLPHLHTSSPSHHDSITWQVEQLEASSKELLRQKEELHQVLQSQQQQATVALQEESRQLLLQNQELQQQVPDPPHNSVLSHFLLVPMGPLTQEPSVFQLAELHKVVEEQQELRSRLSQVDSRRTQAEEQVRSW